MKLAFKYSLLVLTVLIGVTGLVGTYFLLENLENAKTFRLNFVFLVALSIPSLFYQSQTLVFYNQTPRANATNLDEDLILSDTHPKGPSNSLQVLTAALALQVTGFISYVLYIMDDSLITKSDSDLWSYILFTAFFYYTGMGMLIDLFIVRKKMSFQTTKAS